jgi:hypothetical protein
MNQLRREVALEPLDLASPSHDRCGISALEGLPERESVDGNPLPRPPLRAVGRVLSGDDGEVVTASPQGREQRFRHRVHAAAPGAEGLLPHEDPHLDPRPAPP